jgi:hypothetical protein
VRRQFLEQVGRIACHAPIDIGRPYIVHRKRPRGLAPAVEIGLVSEGYEVHLSPLVIASEAAPRKSFRDGPKDQTWNLEILGAQLRT